MRKIIEESMAFVALRALDPKDGSNTCCMVKYEAGELMKSIIQHVSTVLSESSGQFEEIKRKLEESK